MTKITKSERKWGKDVVNNSPKKSVSKDNNDGVDVELYKILIENSALYTLGKKSSPRSPKRKGRVSTSVPKKKIVAHKKTSKKYNRN